MRLADARTRFVVAAFGLALVGLVAGLSGGRTGDGATGWLGVRAAHAQAGSMPCNDGDIDKMVTAINDYRKDDGSYVRVVSNGPSNGVLYTAPEDQKGLIELPTEENLMKSAEQMAQRLADGTYDYGKGHHQQDPDGENGPTVRAIKSGWAPRWNTVFDASVIAPHTGVRENLHQGPARDGQSLLFSEALKGWQNSPGHNYALLKSQAHAIGVGCAQNATNTYWVFLVESEAHMDETSANLQQYFGFNKLWRLKPGSIPVGAVADVMEWVEGGLDAIRNK